MLLCRFITHEGIIETELVIQASSASADCGFALLQKNVHILSSYV